jgi:hypothetical protein
MQRIGSEDERVVAAYFRRLGAVFADVPETVSSGVVAG